MTVGTVGECISRARELVSELGSAGPLAVVCHDDPDPDCIASALALCTIAESVGTERVDHATPGANTEFPAEVPVDIVVDHHPHPNGPNAGIVDVRTNPGDGEERVVLVSWLRGA